MSVPFNPTLPQGTEYDYRVEVSDHSVNPPVVFHTNWQMKSYADKTYAALKAAFPGGRVKMLRRTLRVQDHTP